MVDRPDGNRKASFIGGEAWLEAVPCVARGVIGRDFGAANLQAALGAEVVGWKGIEEFLLWWPPHLRWSLSARDAKRISDFENLALIGEERDDTHGSLAARTL